MFSIFQTPRPASSDPNRSRNQNKWMVSAKSVSPTASSNRPSQSGLPIGAACRKTQSQGRRSLPPTSADCIRWYSVDCRCRLAPPILGDGIGERANGGRWAQPPGPVAPMIKPCRPGADGADPAASRPARPAGCPLRRLVSRHGTRSRALLLALSAWPRRNL